MRHRAGLLCVLALVVALLPAAVAAADSGDEQDAGAEQGTYIVVLERGDPHGVAAEHAGGQGTEVDHVYTAALQGYAARMSEREAEQIASDSRVAAVEPDHRVAVAQHDTDSGEDAAADDRVPTGLQRISWQDSSAYAGGEVATVDVGVAIVDTGIDPDHPDLNVVGGHNCLAGPTAEWQDGNGHGTHVAGTVAANGDILGIAPGTPLHAVRVLDDQGVGTLASLLCGIDWVTAHAATISVANMSLGGGGIAGPDCDASALRAAICDSVGAGVTYVAAAGNSSADVSWFVPAAFPEVITVGALSDFDGEAGGQGPPTCAVDVDDTWAGYSNYSEADGGVDLAAPGTCIASTWAGGGYHTVSGTSMSAAHVTGAAALYLSGSPGAGPEAVRSALVAAGNDDYAYTWDGTVPVPGPQPPLLDVRDF